MYAVMYMFIFHWYLISRALNLEKTVFMFISRCIYQDANIDLNHIYYVSQW